MALVRSGDGFTSARYEYSPFGETLRATGPMAKANPFRFSTKFEDGDSNLLYYGLRFYSVSMGRWLSRDPIEEEDVNNLYAFVLNSPAIGVDPLGNLTLVEEGSVAGIEGNMMADAIGAGRQAWGMYNRVRDAVDTFNTIQEVADMVMKGDFAEDFDTDDMLGQFLNFGNQAVAMGIRGGANKYTRKGNKQHSIFYRAAEASGMIANRNMGNGKRPDALDIVSGIVYELKPWSKSGRRAGTKQLKEYVDYLNKVKMKGISNWIGELVFY